MTEKTINVSEELHHKLWMVKAHYRHRSMEEVLDRYLELPEVPGGESTN